MAKETKKQLSKFKISTEFLKKAKRAEIGEIRQRKNGKFEKQDDGSWDKITDEQSLRIKQYLSDKTDAELMDLLKLKNPTSMQYQIVKTLKQRKDERTRYYKEVTDTANKIAKGTARIDRLSCEEEQGRIAGGKRNIEASIIASGRGRMDRQSFQKQGFGESQRQQERLVTWAKETGCWLNQETIINSAVRQYPSGMESDVYKVKQDDKDFIVKITDYTVMEETPMSFIDNHISIHNFLFPETKYELLGFCTRKGKLNFVLLQPYVDGGVELDELARQSEAGYELGKVEQLQRLEDYMKERFDMSNFQGTFYNDRYTVDDLHLRNVMEKDGEFFFIDTAAGLNTPEDIDGKASYLDFKIIK